MSITIFSFIIAILWCNVYVVIITLMRKRDGFLLYFSYFPLIFLIFTGVFRLICPLELPYTIVIPSKMILPALYNFFTMPLFISTKIAFSVCVSDIFMVVWAIGGIYLLLKYMYQLIQLNKAITAVPGTKDKRIISFMDEIVGGGKANTKVKVIQSPEITVPMVTGYFRPTIYLPVIPFSDDELKLILRHEWTHFLHKDAWVKTFMYLIALIFWWNPFVYVLKRDLNHILEVKCDLSLASQMNEEARIGYLGAITKVAKHMSKAKSQFILPVDAAGLIEANSAAKIEQRFYLVLGYESGKLRRAVFNVLLCGLILLSVIASYMFVIQTSYYHDQSGEVTTFLITSENSYLVDNKDGTYSLYSDGKYRCDINENDVSGEPFSLLMIKE